MMIRDKFEHAEAVAVVLNETLLALYKYTRMNTGKETGK